MSSGLLISPWSIRCWSRSRRALTCSTSASTLACSTARSSTSIRASRAWSSVSVRASTSSANRAASGRERRWWRSRSAWESSSCRSSSLTWADGSAFTRAPCAVQFGGWSSAVLPHVRAAGAHPDLHRIVQGLTQPRRQLREPGPLRRPGGDVEQRGSALLQELAGHVVAQVAGDVDIRPAGEGLVEQEVAGASGHGHPSYGAIGGTADEHPTRGRGEGTCHSCGVLPQGGLVDVADPSGAGGGGAGVGELEDVVGDLLVGVCRQDGPDDVGPSGARQDGLDPELVGQLQLTDGADRGRGSGQRPEPALPRDAVGNRVVVAHVAGPGAGQGGADRLGIADRGEHDDLVERRAARREGSYVA